MSNGSSAIGQALEGFVIPLIREVITKRGYVALSALLSISRGGGGEDERRSEGEIAFFNDEVVLIPSEQTILGALF